MIKNIIKQAKSAKEKLNILSFVCHEPYELSLAETGHWFFDYSNEQTRKWNHECRTLPKNFTLIDDNFFPTDIKYDLILSHNKFGHLQKAKEFQQRFGIPIINLEHTLPPLNWPDEYLREVKKLNGEYNVFISDYSRDQWLWKESEARVIRHGINTDVFSPDFEVPKQRYILATVNDWINRDWCCNFKLWERVTKGLPARVRGNTPGLSTGTKTIEELIHEFRSAQVFISTAKISPIPMSLLEAMSTGCAAVSSATCMVPEFMVPGENGFLTNDEKQMREYLVMLLDDPELCRRIGEAGRQTILDEFSMDAFVSNWNKLFRECVDVRG